MRVSPSKPTARGRKDGNAPLVPQYTCIVHEDGDPPKGIDGALDNSRTVHHRRRVHNGIAARWQR